MNFGMWFQTQSPARTGSRLRGRLPVALRTLPASQRAVVVLREMQGLSTREVADAMGISEANVKTRLSRARKALQSALEAAE